MKFLFAFYNGSIPKLFFGRFRECPIQLDNAV